MKLDVPFYPQTSATNCGPAALQMILAYFGSHIELEVIEREAGIEPGKGLNTIQLALAAARLGLSARFYTTSLEFNPAYANMAFYKTYASMTESRMNSLVGEARSAGVVLQERSLPLTEVLSYVHCESLVLILIDWNRISGKEGYQGHFVPIVGYDEKNVLVHNPLVLDVQAFVPIERALFDQARKALGTDEDCIVIFKKH